MDSISIHISLSHLLTFGVYNPDQSKHFCVFSPALQSYGSPGRSPNPQNADGVVSQAQKKEAFKKVTAATLTTSTSFV